MSEERSGCSCPDCAARVERITHKPVELSQAARDLIRRAAVRPEFSQVVREGLPPREGRSCREMARVPGDDVVINRRVESRSALSAEGPLSHNNALYLGDLKVEMQGVPDSAALRGWRGANLRALGILPARWRTAEDLPVWRESFCGEPFGEGPPDDGDTIFECVDCPCTAGPSAGFIQKLWIELANTVVSAEDKSDLAALPDPATPYSFEFGGGLVRTDFYAAVVCLGETISAATILKQIRDDPNGLGSTEFNDQVTWPKAGPEGRKDLDVVNLDIWGPDNGAIAYLSTSLAGNRFTVVTVSNRESGGHPVSGIRTWGYSPLNTLETMFYTASIESANAKLTGGVGASLQSALWVSLMEAIAAKAVAAGGKRCEVYSASEWNSLAQSRILKERKASGYKIDETHLDPPDSIEVEKLF